jgi:mono/diheme cytochrome c family protein
MEPILTEPAIQQPGEITFDANGRMFVLELRSYMLDADSKDELKATSRISRWEDKDNDGVYETGTVFIDHLIFPRFVLPYGKDAILTMESDQDNVYKYTDTNGDGKADKKELFTTKYGRNGNVEHQQAFMYYGMDNWLYSTVNAFRIRETPNGIIREKTGSNRAQWGITHDDDGKLWFQGGASGVPSYFQFPIHYGNFDFDKELADGFQVPWGAAVKIADMQGGMDEVRQPDGSLNRVTGSAGNDVFRGDRLPSQLKGQYFYGEPVARIVRQINPELNEGLTTLHNVYQDQKSEFIKTTDPLFRPVDMSTAPDGTMYIVDMYHGIIQEGQWTPKGSYLRTKIEQYQLDKIVGLGRIWRLTYEGIKRDQVKPNMYTEKAATLVGYLTHPNGWWRDAAQHELVMRKDQTVVPSIIKIVNSSSFINARIQAIWTLEGLNALSTSLVKKLMNDLNPRIRIQAMRAGETLYKAGDKTLEANYKAKLNDEQVDVVIQAMLSEKFLKFSTLNEDITKLMAKNATKGVQLVGGQIVNPKQSKFMGGSEVTKEQTEMLERGQVIFNELCAQCHGENGLGKAVGAGKLMAPTLSGSLRVQSHPDYVIKVLLHGMEGAIEGKTYAGGLMAPMNVQNNNWIADIASYIRSQLSNDAAFVTPDQVAKLRKSTAQQKVLYKYETLTKTIPKEISFDTSWLVTASHTFNPRVGGNQTPISAFSFEGWSTGKQQEKGMWFQVQLPREVNLAALQFKAPQIMKFGPKPAKGMPYTPPTIFQSFPREYTIELSMDGKNWVKESSNVKGVAGENTVSFKDNTKAKYIRLTLNETVPSNGELIPWSMNLLKLFVYKK